MFRRPVDMDLVQIDLFTNLELFGKPQGDRLCIGFQSVKAFNSYWDTVGKTFEDADGYRIVFQRAAWNNADVAKKYRARGN